MSPNLKWFAEARYGLFVHYGLYSLLARGEWVMNKEKIPAAEYRKLADQFQAEAFDAGAVADLAVAGGMRYIIFGTMHHEGFRMYHSEQTDYCSTKTAARRDFTAEIIEAARDRGLKIGLYHSLNNWASSPDGVDALESSDAHRRFIDDTFSRIQELVTRYQPIDILWYDGWWPFDAVGWEAERMNEMVRSIQPGILFNGRNGLPGDFGTPELHLSAPSPWRPWEACFTLNDNWGYHDGDHHWKSPVEVIKMLVRAAQGRGNLLLNIGPRGDGSIPEESSRIIRAVGDWLKVNGECIFGTEAWTFDLQHRGEHRGDWTHHGPMTAKENRLYLIATCPPAGNFALSGLSGKVLGVRRLDGFIPGYRQEGSILHLDSVGPQTGDCLPPVLRIDFDRPPLMYNTGGMREPRVPHPRYDPVESDLATP